MSAGEIGLDFVDWLVAGAACEATAGALIINSKHATASFKHALFMTSEPRTENR
jgi:hypothetical protein